MNDTAFNELAESVTQAGLIGRTESERMAGSASAYGILAFRSLVPLLFSTPCIRFTKAAPFGVAPPPQRRSRHSITGGQTKAKRQKTGDAAERSFISCNQAAALARIAVALPTTYSGRDAGRRFMSGRISRRVAEKIGALLWSAIRPRRV